ncbi:MAG: heparinase II/III family protein [Campylobacteraceae bacterium]
MSWKNYSIEDLILDVDNVKKNLSYIFSNEEEIYEDLVKKHIFLYEKTRKVIYLIEICRLEKKMFGGVTKRSIDVSEKAFKKHPSEKTLFFALFNHLQNKQKDEATNKLNYLFKNITDKNLLLIKQLYRAGIYGLDNDFKTYNDMIVDVKKNYKPGLYWQTKLIVDNSNLGINEINFLKKQFRLENSKENLKFDFIFSISCEQKYFDNYAQSFIKSFKITNPKGIVHIYVTNYKSKEYILEKISSWGFSDIVIANFYDCPKDIDYKPISAVLRMLAVNQLIKFYNKPIFFGEIDAVIKKNLADLIEMTTKNNSNHLVRIIGSYLPWQRFTCGFGLFLPTVQGKNLANKLEQYIKGLYNSKQDNYFWADQAVLEAVIRYTSLEDKTYKFFAIDFKILRNYIFTPAGDSHEKKKYFINKEIYEIEKYSDIYEDDMSILQKKVQMSKNLMIKKEIYEFVKTKRISFLGYEPIYLNKDINWLYNIYDNRTWMWHLHQMAYIIDLIEFNNIYKNNESIEYGLEIINSWYDTFKNDLKNHFAWHDHATALRAQNIIKFYLYLKDINYESKIIFHIEEILILHTKMLLDDKFYSQFTNHGLDQSMALYELSNVIENLKDREEIKQSSTQRINAEISHAFTSDGGHTENSPAYFNFGLKQVLKALSLGEFFEGENTRISFPENILNNAIKALTFITQPNGKLPLIGDTRDFEVRNFFENIKSIEFQNFLYSIRKGKQGLMPSDNDMVLKKSGWAIFRETWKKEKFEKSTHIVFKCGFLSNYHRHDDDLSFTLFSDREEWFVDGGEYKHAHKDPYRIFMRSSDSHNLSKPYNLNAHRILMDSKSTGIKNYNKIGDTSIVEAKSYMFRNFENYRKLQYDRNNSKIFLHDKCNPISEESQLMIKQKYKSNFVTYITKFQIPNDKNIEIDYDKKTVKIIGRNKIVFIDVPNFLGYVKLTKGQKEPTIQGWISRKSDFLEEAYTLEYYHKTEKLDQIFNISFLDKIDTFKTEKRIEVSCDLNGDEISATIYTNLVFKDLKYAFYLMYEDQRIEYRRYDNSNTVVFKLSSNKDVTKYFIIGFILDKSEKKYQQKSYPKL